MTSLKVTKGHLKISQSSFSAIVFCLTPDLLKTFQECKHYKEKKIEKKRSMTVKVMQGHKRPLLCQNHSSTFIY